MHRSPFVALCLLSACVWAQQQPGSSEPKDASGMPQTPVAQPSAGAPAPAPAPQPQLPATTSQGTSQAPTAPSATSPSSGQAATSQPAGSTGQLSTAKGKNGSKSAAVTPEPVAPPEQPKTEILDSSATSGGLSTDGHDPILDPPPFPSGSTTLVGGIIRSVDRIRNRLVISVFGGGHWTIGFDERTHIFRNGAEATELALKKGDRIYVDTMLDQTNHEILARNIRVGVTAPPADASGQITSVDVAHGEVSLRDNINSVPVHFGVDKDTQISSGNTPISLDKVRPGALVHVKFSAQSGYRGVAREINVIAMPGSAFSFNGRVAFLDVHRGVLAVQNIDGRTYDIHFAPRRFRDADNLSVGTTVKIVAIFEGNQYTAQSVQIVSPSGGEAKE